MKKILQIVCVIVFFANTVHAIPLYGFRVTFKNKNSSYTIADSASILSPRALARRQKQNIFIDSTDLPLSASYINQTMLAANAIKLHNTSKWFNQIVVLTFDSSKASVIAALPFVQNVKLVAKYANGQYKKSNDKEELDTKWLQQPEIQPIAPTAKKTRGSASYYGTSWKQVHVTETDFLHDLGYRGNGMQIAVFDAGFLTVNSDHAFDSLHLQNRVLGTWNFKQDTSYIYSISSYHGMSVLGCMAGIKHDSMHYVGTSPDASFYLFVTEDVFSEQPIEEDNWLSAAEKADSLGVDIINCSLGYNTYDPPHASYTYLGDMTGHKTLIAKAANKVVGKGIFVCNAMGNEGPLPWHYLITPADGDSVYAVTAIDSTGAWGGSGYGYNASGQVKPDGCTRGAGIYLVGSNTIGQSNGSSFAAPTMTGGIACLWQALPNLKVWELRDIIHKVSDRYATPDTTFGYGVPNFRLAYNFIVASKNLAYTQQLIQMYPNPSNGIFNVLLLGNTDINTELYLYDMHGSIIERILTKNKKSITITSLKNKPSGIYFLHVKNGEKYSIEKVLKY